MADAEDPCASATMPDGSEKVETLLLPTRTSWSRLSGPMQEIFEEAMKFLDEESTKEMRARDVDVPPAVVCGDANIRRVGGGQQADTSLGMMPPAPAPVVRKRASLDPASVIGIFLAKRLNAGGRSDLSGKLARQHKITAKAVRDIWNMRTWRKTTRPFWNAKDRQAAQARTAPSGSSQAINLSAPTTSLGTIMMNPLPVFSHCLVVPFRI